MLVERDGARADPAATLEAVARRFLTLLLTPSYLALHRMLVAEAPRFPDLAREIYIGGPARAVSELALYLAEENRKGTLAVADPALAAEQFFGALFGHLQLRALLSPREAPGEAEIERAIGHAVRGFLRAQAASRRAPPMRLRRGRCAHARHGARATAAARAEIRSRPPSRPWDVGRVRCRPARQRAQLLGHPARRAPAVVRQHAHQTELLGPRRPQELLAARHRARHDQRRLAEREDLAEGVVAAHRDHAQRAQQQALEAGIEGDRIDLVEPRRAILEREALLEVHERAEHQQRGIRDARVGLIRAQHPVDQILAVAAAAGGDQDVGLGRQLVLVRLRRRGRHGATQVAGEGDLPGERHACWPARSADRRSAAGRTPRSRHRDRAGPDRRSCAATRRAGSWARPSRRAGPARAACPAPSSSVRVSSTSPRSPSGSLSTRNRWGSKMSAVCWMIELRMSSVCSMSMCSCRGVYSPLRSLITPGTRTKSTRDLKSKLPMIGEPDRIRTERCGKLLDQMVSDRAAAAQMPQAETVVAEDQQPGGGIH